LNEASVFSAALNVAFCLLLASRRAQSFWLSVSKHLAPSQPAGISASLLSFERPFFSFVPGLYGRDRLVHPLPPILFPIPSLPGWLRRPRAFRVEGFFPVFFRRRWSFPEFRILPEFPSIASVTTRFRSPLCLAFPVLSFAFFFSEFSFAARM